MMEKQTEQKLSGRIDWPLTVIPVVIIVALCVCFAVWPVGSMAVTDAIRDFIGDKLGFCYVALGCVCIAASLYMAFSRFGRIRLGDTDTPEYSDFKWGAMIFTSTMGADILFYSCCEWALYSAEPYVQQKADPQLWAMTYPIFHWGPTVWSFYIVLSVAFAFMIHVRRRTRQKFSEACRPLLGRGTDGLPGKIIDFMSVFALVGGSATCFSVSTPLLSGAIATVLGIRPSTLLTILVLLLIAAVYTVTVLRGMTGISNLAQVCTYLFFVLMAWVLIAGGEGVYIIESGVQAVGNLIENFIGMTTYMDPARENWFPQSWTIFYWAYWLVWAVGTPFFLGIISKGRTVKNLVLGGYAWGLSGTAVSFIVLQGYASAQQLRHGLDVTGALAAGGDLSETILRIFGTLPLPAVGLILLAVTMVYFYSTTYDSSALVVASYSYKTLAEDEIPDRRIRALWAFLLIALPIILINNQNSLSSLQSITIITAFPLVFVVLMIVVSFFRDARKYLDSE